MSEYRVKFRIVGDYDYGVLELPVNFVVEDGVDPAEKWKSERPLTVLVSMDRVR